MRDFICWGSKITADGDCSHEIKRCLLLGRKAMANLDCILKNRDITLPTKVHSQGYGFSSSHVWIWELDYKESWTLKNWCWKLLRVPWTAKRSNQSILKEISPEYSLESYCEAETPILWPLDVKNWLNGKDPDAGKDWRQEETGAADDEMVVWHHRLDGHEFEWTPRVGDGQGSLLCCSSWVHKESDTTKRLNWN